MNERDRLKEVVARQGIKRTYYTSDGEPVTTIASRIIDDDVIDGFVDGILKLGVTVREKGKWIYNPDGTDWGIGAWECSLCRCKNDNLGMDNQFAPHIYAGSNFCPHCGADMRKEVGE